MPGETGHQYVAVDSLFCFPYFPLVTLYLFPFDFPLSLPFPLRFFSCSPSFWEWPSPKKQPRGDSSLLVARAERDGRREEEPRVDIYRYLTVCTVWRLGAHYAFIECILDYRFESVQYTHILQLSFLQIKPSSYLLFYSSCSVISIIFTGKKTPTEPQNIHQYVPIWHNFRPRLKTLEEAVFPYWDPRENRVSSLNGGLNACNPCHRMPKV